MPVMMREPIVRQLCVGIYRKTNKVHDDDFHGDFPHLNIVDVLTVYYLREVFKAHMEPFWI